MHFNKKLISPAKTGAIVGACALCLGVAGSLAYFTDSEGTVNHFRVAEALDITLTEPNWDTTDADKDNIPDAAEGLVPLQTVAKDPMITNDSEVESYVYLTVKVPRANVATATSTGARQAAALQDLFTYTVNDGWTLLDTQTTSDYSVYTYAYDKTLKEDESTGTLFDSVTLINLADTDQSANLDMPVTAFGIQSLGFSDAKTAWSAYSTQNIPA